MKTQAIMLSLPTNVISKLHPSRQFSSPKRVIRRPRHIRPHRNNQYTQWRCADALQDDPSTSGSSDSFPENFSELDLNQLQTALHAAIEAEEYGLAAQIRDVLCTLLGPDFKETADWQRLGIIDWLAERAKVLGFRIPTEVQRRAAPVILDGDDCLVESETGSGKTLAFLLPSLSSLSYPPETYPDDLKAPPLVIIVPTRELGVQVAMLTFKLFGGSTNAGIPGQRTNMFHYDGPRGIKVRGLLLADEADSVISDVGVRGAHVLVGTPQLIAQVMEKGVNVVQDAKLIVIDEVDACLKDHPEYMDAIMLQACESAALDTGRKKPVVVIAGASLSDATVEQAVAAGWLEDPVRVAVGPRMKIPKGLSHRYIIAKDEDRVGAMCRQLRADLEGQNPDNAPPRVMIFAASQDQAIALSDPLRTVLWGDHKISVLLPEGAEPIQALHSFRDNQTTLLLATPAAARGLDLPAVSHVYNISPPEDAADYLHRAGRAGRIGQSVPGTVTTMVSQEELPQLEKLAEELGITLQQEKELGPFDLRVDDASDLDVDKAKKALEDLFKLK